MCNTSCKGLLCLLMYLVAAQLACLSRGWVQGSVVMLTVVQ